MATRNLTMVVDRQHAEKNEEGFAANPSVYSDKSYVNMYLHHDGYPAWQGVQIANWVHKNGRLDGSAMAAKLVHDMYYDSCYLYASLDNIDHNYTYIIWSGKKDIWISCYDQYTSTCVFVLKPEKVISKYMEDMEYTDFANDETRYGEKWKKNNLSNKVDLSMADVNRAKVHAGKLINILTGGYVGDDIP